MPSTMELLRSSLNDQGDDIDLQRFRKLAAEAVGEEANGGEGEDEEPGVKKDEAGGSAPPKSAPGIQPGGQDDGGMGGADPGMILQLIERIPALKHLLMQAAMAGGGVGADMGGSEQSPEQALQTAMTGGGSAEGQAQMPGGAGAPPGLGMKAASLNDKEIQDFVNRLR